MKKRLILFLCLIVTICAVFAISASAKTITTIDGVKIEVTTYNDFTMPTNIQYSIDDVVVFNDGFACPSAYVFVDSKTVNGGKWGGPSIATAFNFEYINGKTGKSYTFDDVVEIDFPQGITSLGKYMAHKVTNIKRVSIPDSVTSLGDCVFQEATNLQQCTFEHNENSSLTTITTYAFYKTALTAISLPDCVTTIAGEAAFSACSSLGALHLPANLTTMKGGSQGKATFDGCNNMYFVSEAFTYDNVPEKPEVYYFPANFSTISNECIFRYCNNLNDVLVFDTAMKSVPNQHTFQCTYGQSPNITIVFLGDMETISTAGWGSVSRIIFANEADKSSTDIASYSNSRTTIFCASESDMTKHLESPRHSVISPATCYSNKAGVVNCFCGREISRGEYEGTMLKTHNYVDDFDCTTKNYCENYGENKCDKYLDADASSHSEKHTVIFSEGLLEAGVHNTFCENATCKVLDNEEALNPMFGTSGGYAISKAGGLAGGWTIDLRALELYNQYNEKKVTYGVVMINPKHLASEKFFNDDYTVNLAQGKTGAVITSSTDCEYSNLAFSINGFTTTELCELELVIAAYAYVDGEAVQFIQEQNTECKANTLDYEDASLYTVSYESAGGLDDVDAIEAIVPSKED